MSSKRLKSLKNTEIDNFEILLLNNFAEMKIVLIFVASSESTCYESLNLWLSMNLWFSLFNQRFYKFIY